MAQCRGRSWPVERAVVGLLEWYGNGIKLVGRLLSCPTGNIWTFMRHFVIFLSYLLFVSVIYLCLIQRFLYETQCSSGYIPQQ